MAWPKLQQLGLTLHLAFHCTIHFIMTNKVYSVLSTIHPHTVGPLHLTHLFIPGSNTVSTSSTISILSEKTRVGRPVKNYSCESTFPVPPCCTASAGPVSSLSRNTASPVDCQQILTQTDRQSPPCGLLQTARFVTFSVSRQHFW